jgi:CubicO group peptidase (beta-lactamase class C family)
MVCAPNPQVDQIFAQWNKSDSPGFALAVSKDGKTVYSRGYGMADLDHNIPIEPGTVFHAASLAKQFTAMAIMLLVDKHQLSLDDEIRGFISLKTEIPPITIRQMLHHISGIRDQWILATMAGWRLSDDVVTRDDVVDRFVARMTTLNFVPGAKYSYSNTNYTLAAEIVKKVSGLSLSEFSRRYIFEPLGMSKTKIIETHGQIVKHRAYGYSGKYPNFQVSMPNYDLTGPTNLQTTVEDLIRWDHNFDLKTVGGEAALSAMLTAVPTHDGTGESYGLGLFINTENGRRIIEHNGRDAGYRSHLIRYPDEKLAVALLCNLALPDETATLTKTLVREVAAVYLGGSATAARQRLADRRQAVAATVDLNPFLGRYYSEELDTVYHIVPSGSSIAIARHKYDPTVLTFAAPNIFSMEGFTIFTPSMLVEFDSDLKSFVLDDISDEFISLLRAFRFKKMA